MKPLFISGAALLLWALSAAAQKPDTAQVLLHYKFTWVRDTMDRAHPYMENMVLLAGKNAGAYKSYDGMVQDAQFKKQVEQAIASSPDGNIRVNHNHSASGTEYYLFPNEQKFYMKDKLLDNIYLVEEPVPAIDWKVSGDTASFGGLHCQKATCHFKGRDYTAWFCPDLPLRTGPWKLTGLPGVIVDAHDARNEVVFKFDGVEKAVPSSPKSSAGSDDSKKSLAMMGIDADADPNLIALPGGAIKTNYKDFSKLQDAMHNDPQGFGKAMTVGDGPKRQISFKSGGPHGPAINNPIELPEKR